jgi:ElaB/YqjD/DUF883 family membrane-anchored ribosome-binding protein
VSALRDRLSEQSEKLVEDVREFGNIALEEAGAVVHGARRRGERTFAEGRERVHEGADAIESLVTGNPFRSVAVALGAGILLGLFLRR